MQIPSLTGLRAIAAFLVLAFHVGLAVPSLRLSQFGIIGSGLVGVTIFFVLSGFVLGISQLRGPTGTVQDLRAFWQSRAARILPTYYVAVLVALLVRGTEDADPAKLVIASLTLTQPWFPDIAFKGHGQAWSLGAELVFYLLFPFIAIWTSRLWPRGLRGAIIGTLGVILVIAALYVNGLISWELTYLNPIFRLPEFVLGVLLARVYAGQPAPQVRWGEIALAAWGGVFVVLSVWGKGISASPGLHPVLVPLIAIGIYGLARAEPSALASRLLGSRTMVFLGQISFALYLWHGIVLLFIQRSAYLDGWPAVMVGVALSLLLATASYRWIESPGISMFKPRRVHGTASMLK